MVFEYLQRAVFFHENPQTYNVGKGQESDAARKRRLSKPAQQVGFLSPVTRLLRTTSEAVNNAVLHIRDGLTEEQRAAQRRKEERKQILHLRIKNAETVDDWRAAARELDLLEDNEAWKSEKHSEDFDALLIEARLIQLDDARINCDVNRMLYLVRTSLSRDLGGMTNSRLYKHSNIGTKHLIERYIDSTLATIRALVETSVNNLPTGLETKDILEQVVYARQAFGRSALLLSGGATFGMTHVGVLKALFDAHLLPRIISGASAGSIVCAVLCTRTDEEIPEVLKTFPYGDLAVFEKNDEEDGLLERLGRLLTKGAWIDIKHLVRVMKALLGDMTFQEAYNRTRRILNICVSSASIYELPRLLNYVTSPNVMIWSAVAASCSVPVLFSAAYLLVKNPITGEHLPWNPTPQRWIDGSVDNDLPMTRLAEMFNVNHFIVSQVNPHVVPFLAKDDAAVTHDSQYVGTTDWLYTVTNLAKGEALHRMQVLADLGIFPNLVTKARSVLSQKYSGDITILPEIYYRDFPRILKNPTSDFMVQACMSGERATWPKLSRIRNHCAVELELDAAVQQLRARVVFSPSQVNLMRFTNGVSSLTSSGPSGTRKRRVSGSNAIAISVVRGPEDDNNADSGKDMVRPNARPPLRAASSHFDSFSTRRAVPLLTSEVFGLKASASVPPQDRNVSPFHANISCPLPARNKLRLSLGPDVLDLTSEAETTDGHVGLGSSDADVDSRTDDSSPEPESTARQYLTLNSLSTQSKINSGPSLTPSQASFFSIRPAGPSSQPTTPGLGISGYYGSLSLNATTPPSSVANTPAMLSPELKMTPSMASSRGRAISKGTGTRDGEDKKDMPDGALVSNPSSPERRYKRMFHGATLQTKGSKAA